MHSDHQILRAQLLALLRGGNAHMTIVEAVAGFPVQAINRRPPNVPYNLWQLLEHMRIAQWDILEFIRNPDHLSPDWPEGYWPASGEAGEDRWQQTLAAFLSDLSTLQDLVSDPHTDLLADLTHAKGYNILREILVVSDHNAYHLGEFAALRQVMGTWPED